MAREGQQTNEPILAQAQDNTPSSGDHVATSDIPARNTVVPGEVTSTAIASLHIGGTTTGRAKALIIRVLNSSLVGAALIALVVVFSVASSHFLSSTNVETIFDSVAVIAVLTIGQVFVIITAGIDLSQGAVIALTGVVGAQMMSSGDVLVGIIVALAVGLAVGMFNGVLTAFTRVPAFIVTLGTLSIAGGVALLDTGGEPIYQLPSAMSNFGTRSFWIFPYIIIVTIILAVIMQALLSFSRFGRSIYAIGSNRRAALLSGLPVRRNTVAVYVISGLMSAIGGILLTAYVNSALPTAGADYELDAIAAVVIGGGSLFGGQGTIWAAMLGALLLSVLSNGTELLGVSTYAETVILGGVVIGAVFIDSFRRRVAV